MRNKLFNLPYQAPDSEWSVMVEETIVCQSSTIPDLEEGDADFEWI